MFKFVCGKCCAESVECQTNGKIRKGKFICEKCLSAERAKDREIEYYYDLLITRVDGKPAVFICKAGFRKTKKTWIKIEGTDEFTPPLPNTATCGNQYRFFGEKYNRRYKPPGFVSVERALEYMLADNKMHIDQFTRQAKDRQATQDLLMEFKASLNLEEKEEDAGPSQQV